MPSTFKEILGRTAKAGANQPQRKALDDAARAFRDGVALVLDGVIDKLLDNIFRGAETSQSGDEQRKLMAAYGVLYENRVRFNKWIEKAVNDRINTAIDEFEQHRPTASGVLRSQTDTELSLVENEAMDRFVLAARVGTRVESVCVEVMRELNGRVAAVAGLFELPQGTNPFRPELFALALDDAWREVRLDPQHDAVVLERLTTETLADLKKALAAANGALADAGYEVPKPGVRTGIHRTRPPERTAPAAAQPPADDPRATSAKAGAGGGSDKQTSANKGAGFFKQLSDLVSRQVSRAVSGLGGSPKTAPEHSNFGGFTDTQPASDGQGGNGTGGSSGGAGFGAGASGGDGVGMGGGASGGGGSGGGGSGGGGSGGGGRCSGDRGDGPSGSGATSPEGRRVGQSTMPRATGSMLSPQAIEALGRLVPSGAVPTASQPRLLPALSHLQRAQFEQPLDFGQAVALQPMMGADGEPLSNYMDPMSSLDVALNTPLQIVNVIRNIAQSGLTQHASQVDSTVIELVARLFDFVFEDENLPDAIKVLLSRMQIPVLKAAMLDTDFFEHDNHPARRLVNGLADAGLGWETYDGREDPLYQMIERTVQRVLEDFAEDLTLFNRLADEVDAFVQQTNQDTLVAAEPELAVKRQEAQSEEGVQLATGLARRAVDERLRETPTLPFVSVFLRHTWSDFMGGLLAIHSPIAPEVETALETADDLLWSVLPKTQPDERRQLLVKMPDLERQLRNGAQRTEMPIVDEDEFFQSLDDRWAGAVIGEPIIIPDDFEAAIAEAEADPEPDEALGQVLELTAGAILEMVKDDGVRFCYKVGWISEGHTRMLLTNRLNSAPLIVTAEHLAERLREGKLRIIDRGPLVDRAMNSILAALEEVRYTEQDAPH